GEQEKTGSKMDRGFESLFEGPIEGIRYAALLPPTLAPQRSRPRPGVPPSFSSSHIVPALPLAVGPISAFASGRINSRRPRRKVRLGGLSHDESAQADFAPWLPRFQPPGAQSVVVRLVPVPLLTPPPPTTRVPSGRPAGSGTGPTAPASRDR